MASVQLASQRCIFYIDNIPAQDAFVRGTSSNPHVRDLALVRKLREVVCAVGLVCKVASPSIIADDPSRAVPEPLLKAGCSRVTAPCAIRGFRVGLGFRV